MFEEKAFAENIKYYRLLADMTQEELASRLYVTAQTISKWENALSFPSLDKLCNLAQMFGVSVDALLRGAAYDSKKTMIAIDGGGTKTEFVLFCDDGKIISRILLGGSNPNVYGIDSACNLLRQGIDTLLASDCNVSGIFAGIAGAATGKNGEKIADYLKKCYAGKKIYVGSDIECVMGSVRNQKKCMAAICGTGSIVYADDGKNLHRAGGWGYLFDKAGSGYDIGRDALTVALEAESGFSDASPLVYALEQSVGGRVFDKLDELYAKGKDYIASFARVVMKMYNEDEKAREIVEVSMKRLAYLANQLYTKHDCGNVLIISGGMTRHKEILEKLLKKYLPDQIKIVFPKFAPVYGACLKCMAMCNVESDAEIFDKNFEKDYDESRG